MNSTTTDQIMQLAREIVAEQKTLPKRGRAVLYLDQNPVESVAKSLGRAHVLYGGEGRYRFRGVHRSRLYRPDPVIDQEQKQEESNKLSRLVEITLKLQKKTKAELVEQLSKLVEDHGLTEEASKDQLIATLALAKATAHG
jgi:hypothetical protein